MREEQRVRVVAALDVGKVTGSRAAALMGLSLRQTWRLLAAYRREGPRGLRHGNRGREPANKLSATREAQIVALARERYSDYNDTHLTEKLEDIHHIKVSRPTLRRLRRSIGQESPRRRRVRKHRIRRERFCQEGMLLQIDGSPHDWLEGRGAHLTLLVAIDDATSNIPYAVFREKEDDAGYFELLWEISCSQGLPMAVYSDKHTIFRSPKQATLEQELSGEPPRSQFQRAMDELGVEVLHACSPQAKGRVERLFGTLQDRLVKELREANATTREEANQVLQRYLPLHNARFAEPAAIPGSAYHPWPDGLRREIVFSLQHQRQVRNDNTISFSGHLLQIPPGPDQLSYAGVTVDVQQRLDGSLAICKHDQALVVYQPASDEPVRANKFTPAATNPSLQGPSHPSSPPAKPRTPHQPAADHPWRHMRLSPSQVRPPSAPTHKERQNTPAGG